MIILAAFAFLSGIITILSPCILPVLPVVLSGSVGGRRRPAGIIVGFVASFTAFTLLLSAIVRLLHLPPDILRTAAVIVIIGFGLVMTVPALTKAFESLASRITSRGPEGKGFFGGLAIGASLGLIWTPCVGPIMASVITLAVANSVDGGSVVIALSYALGTAIPMTGIMAGGRSLIKRFPALTAHTGRIQRVFGVLLLAAGVSVGFGLDRRFQAAVLDIFPTWGTGLTAFEQSDTVRNALDKRADGGTQAKTGVTSSGVFKYGSQTPKPRLSDYGFAPEIIADGEWFNSGPLTMEALRGKVVLIDFWTYSCVNCIRTIPYLKSWHDTYADSGLVIIGVHAPEFAFERNPDNLRKAIKDLGVTWPVVADNDFRQWRAYGNRYWPAKFFIDARGKVRYYHFGEGKYKESENIIRTLLKETGANPGGMAEAPDAASNFSGTPETYLGYRRTKGFAADREILKDEAAEYAFSVSEGNGVWGLSGEWTFTPEYVTPQTRGKLRLGFEAKNVFLVIEDMSGNLQPVEVLLDGRIPGNTPDVKNGRLMPAENRLYQLIGLEKAGTHTLQLTVPPGVRLYAFTFG